MDKPDTSYPYAYTHYTHAYILKTHTYIHTYIYTPGVTCMSDF